MTEKKREQVKTKVKERRSYINQNLKEKIMESLRSTLPITFIVMALSMTITPMPIGSLMLFLFGALMLILGLGIFTLGADLAMVPMGEGMGVYMSKSKKLGLAIVLCFILGVIITIAEPDLQVLAQQVPAIDSMTLIMAVAIGVGIFLVVALLRIYFQVPLAYMLIGFYVAVFTIAFFAPNDFIPLAFDSGGVTTGPVTVPFIMAFGIGMASLRSDKASREDSFGLVGLCSIGPILAVLILSIIYNPSTAEHTYISIPDVSTSADITEYFMHGLPEYVKEVALAILPIVLMFGVFQIATKRFQKKQLMKMVFGLLYTYVGLVLFLTGVNVGFMPVGHYIGGLLAGSKYIYLLVPIGMIIGYFIVEAEPAVHVLKKQVEELSNGAISQKTLQKSLSVGVACAVGISMIRVIWQIPIFYFLIPGYIIALGLAFFVPKFFTAVAFDSGGVASGPMTATFLLPFAMGATQALGGNILTDTFGVVAMVAMTPLIAIQVLGFISVRKQKHLMAQKKVDPRQALADSMVYYEEVSGNA
ncbi:DUF1538 domain-containing protein [Christensenellaceae bacterium OttesenSCG-928-M15]|nr:DUF1538 domain-containing protein [Christensenellaceae bacterium OttesenSCG-928-M15]